MFERLCSRRGSDRFIYDDGKIEKVEVKGVSKPYGIPDMRVNEFRNKRLKADYLLVVENVTTPRKRRLYKIPRIAIKPNNLILLQTYRITRFQGKKNMNKYRVL
jgi:transposase